MNILLLKVFFLIKKAHFQKYNYFYIIINYYLYYFKEQHLTTH